MDQPDALGDGQILRAMPSGAVELEHDDAIALALVSRTTASSSFAKKGLLTRFERNQTVSPLAGATKAVRHRASRSDDGRARWTLSDRGADAAMDWLQAEPVLVGSQTSIGLSGCFTASSVSVSASSF